MIVEWKYFVYSYDLEVFQLANDRLASTTYLRPSVLQVKLALLLLCVWGGGGWASGTLLLVTITSSTYGYNVYKRDAVIKS